MQNEKIRVLLSPIYVGLFNLISNNYRDEAIVRKEKYILVKGGAPVMLLAHMDTVHKTPVKHICESSASNIIMSPEGIGGYDRYGVYALIKVHEQSQVTPWLLFTCDEEIDGVGASAFTADYHNNKLSKELDSLKFLIEIDRTSSKDTVYSELLQRQSSRKLRNMNILSMCGVTRAIGVTGIIGIQIIGKISEHQL